MYALIIYNLGEIGWHQKDPRVKAWERIEMLSDNQADCRSRISYLRKKCPELTIKAYSPGIYTAYLYQHQRRLKAWEAEILWVTAKDLRLKIRLIDRYR